MHPSERGELGRDRLPQLVELRDVPRLDELAHAPLEPRPDPAQLPDSPGADEVGDRERRAPNELGAASERADGVAARVGQLEQRRVLGQGRRDLLVGGWCGDSPDVGTVPDVARVSEQLPG